MKMNVRVDEAKLRRYSLLLEWERLKISKNKFARMHRITAQRMGKLLAMAERERNRTINAIGG